MSIRTLSLGAALASVLAVAPAAGQDWTPPETEWGEPDLRGLWPIGHLTGTPLERPEEYGEQEFISDEEYQERLERAEQAQAAYDRETSSGKMGMGHWAERGDATRRTSLIVDPPNGRLPAFTEEGERLSAEMGSSWKRGQVFDWVDDFDSWDRCITRGMPASMFPFQYNNGIRIFQAPGVVAINMEMVHETRVIPTDGSPALPVAVRHWMGESRGHWEGDTLVVETTNLKPGPSATNIGTSGSPRSNDTPVSEQAVITERFTRIDEDTIEYELTHDDPVVFTAPWTAKLTWRMDPEYGMFEYACHEGQYMVRDYINASRAERGLPVSDGAGE
jgi:hypothetical protein